MTSRRLVLTRSAAVIGAASTGLLLPEIARAQSGKLRVGLMLPYTGTFAQLGVAIENGFRMAIDEHINNTLAIALREWPSARPLARRFSDSRRGAPDSARSARPEIRI